MFDDFACFLHHVVLLGWSSVILNSVGHTTRFMTFFTQQVSASTKPSLVAELWVDVQREIHIASVKAIRQLESFSRRPRGPPTLFRDTRIGEVASWIAHQVLSCQVLRVILVLIFHNTVVITSVQ